MFPKETFGDGAELGFRTAEGDVSLGYLWFQWALRRGGLWAEVQPDGHQEGGIIEAIRNGSMCVD